ncbi:hypothetical protein GCM10009591_01160 [Brachybacterium tyrofermentans]
MFWAETTAMMPTTIFQPLTSGVIGWVRRRAAVSVPGSTAVLSAALPSAVLSAAPSAVLPTAVPPCPVSFSASSGPAEGCSDPAVGCSVALTARP